MSLHLNRFLSPIPASLSSSLYFHHSLYVMLSLLLPLSHALARFRLRRYLQKISRFTYQHSWRHVFSVFCYCFFFFFRLLLFALGSGSGFWGWHLQCTYLCAKFLVHSIGKKRKEKYIHIYIYIYLHTYTYITKFTCSYLPALLVCPFRSFAFCNLFLWLFPWQKEAWSNACEAWTCVWPIYC